MAWTEGERNYPPHQLLFWLLNPGLTAAEAVAELQETDVYDYSDCGPQQVGDEDAACFDLITAETIGFSSFGSFVSFPSVWDTNSENAHIRLLFFEHSDRTIMVYIEAPVEEFDDFMEEAQSILNSLAFR